MILGFKPGFSASILKGTKVHTIRRPRKRREWRVGDSIQFYEGVRTKRAFEFATSTVERVRPIHIRIEARPQTFYVAVRGHPWNSIGELAYRDGFMSVEHFAEFFLPKRATRHGLLFDAAMNLIEWGEVKEQ